MGHVCEIPVERIDGTPVTLGEHRGKVVLVVNVASRCGLTPQYAALEKLYRTYRDRGFVVCGFPANDFAGQEPGSNPEIASFCHATFDVDFPLYAKIQVTGADKHPLYAALTAQQPATTGETASWREHLREYGVEPTPEPEVLWNFEKFLLSRSGEVVARFAPHLPPEAPELREAIERELARG